MRGGVDRGHDRAGREPPRPPALIAVALVGVLGIVVLLVFGFSLGAWWAVGSPALGRHSDGLDTFLEAFRIVLSVVAGLGGVVALVMVYRRQRFGEIADHRADLAEQRENTRLLHERFRQAVEQLGHDNPSVRLGGVHAMTTVADDWDSREGRQMCIDVLCSYLRMPVADEPSPGEAPDDHLAWRAFREVRHTILRIIAAHLRPDGSAVGWQGHDFDLRGITVDLDWDLTGAVFPDDSTFDLSGAIFSAGRVNLGNADFIGGTVSFVEAEFAGATVGFHGARFTDGTVSFDNAGFTAGDIHFDDAAFEGGDVRFDRAEFVGGTVDFDGARFTTSDVHRDQPDTAGRAIGFGSAVSGFCFHGRPVAAPGVLLNLPPGTMRVQERAPDAEADPAG